MFGADVCKYTAAIELVSYFHSHIFHQAFTCQYSGTAARFGLLNS